MESVFIVAFSFWFLRKKKTKTKTKNKKQKKKIKQEITWTILPNMLDNGNSNLQRKFGVHNHLKYFQNNQTLKSRDYANPLWPPKFESFPYPRGRGGGRFDSFFA